MPCLKSIVVFPTAPGGDFVLVAAAVAALTSCAGDSTSAADATVLQVELGRFVIEPAALETYAGNIELHVTNVDPDLVHDLVVYGKGTRRWARASRRPSRSPPPSPVSTACGVMYPATPTPVRSERSSSTPHRAQLSLRHSRSARAGTSPTARRQATAGRGHDGDRRRRLRLTRDVARRVAELAGQSGKPCAYSAASSVNRGGRRR